MSGIADKSPQERSSIARSDSSLSHDKEEALLGSSGSHHDITRVFSTFDVFCMSFNVVSVVPSIASVLVFSIPGGGTHGMIWAWLVCGVFLTVISLAVAEASSVANNKTVSQSSFGRILSWVAGYATAVGNIANVASVAWACALQIMAAAMIGSGFMFQPSTAQTYGIFCGLLILQGLACSIKPTILARLQAPFLVLSFSLWLALIVTLPASTSPNFNTEKFVFGTFTNVNKAWSDNVFAFLLTFLSPLWAIGRATSISHISEESRNIKSVPFAIVISTATTALMAWVLNIALAFCMGNDLRAILFSKSGEPFATILLNSFSTRGMLATWTFIIILQFNMGLTMLRNTSRQLSAFAKEGAFKCDPLFTHLTSLTHSQRTRTLNPEIWSPIILSILFGLLAFAGSNAVCRTLFSTAVVSQFVAQTIFIWRSRRESDKANFSLGILSLPAATASSIVMVVLSIILVFPDTEHPTGGTMNYTLAILAGTLALSLGDFYFSSKTISVAR
ncbi:hypothetical protein BDN70DRAFT_870934 [Pholiota conissans]|uniref:Amino acid transporter n=1 Tax=Pholiota conissans TaxID=109636 RepID=A0A9P5ZCD7_9AGAR|nr:hypothetical protein BDN70DRAFT_870934 [Pholiota conissans]